MSRARLGWSAVIVALGIGGAIACGPNFPWQLFDDRDQAVADPVALGFDRQAARLVMTRHPGLLVVERDPNQWDQNTENEVLRVERREASSGVWATLATGLPAARFPAKLAAARHAKDGKAAIEAGDGLPPAVLAYVAGAIEFHAERYDEALAYFLAIDRLPPEQRKLRIVAATYMQGRVHQWQGNAEAARAAFQATRSEAQNAPDPMGLGIASLGEEARVRLVEAGLLQGWSMPTEADPKKAAALIADAVRLYAEQAANGSKIAVLSLREVATMLLAQDTLLRQAIADPLVRRLVVAYAVGREEDNAGSAELVTDAMLRLPEMPAGDDLDQLAAVAYQAGRYDVAAKLVEKTERPLGLWVRAKLALRRDDRPAAVRDWMAALTKAGKTGEGTPLDPDSVVRLRGETAVMRFSQGDYVDSLRLLFPVASTYWGDVAYVAERVSTVDELKTFVDELPANAVAVSREGDSWSMVKNPTEALRRVLARRLMREGRQAEAMAYFAKTIESQEPGDKPADVAEARAYQAALEQSKGGQWSGMWTTVSRAEALFGAAETARKRGMELMGTEGPPDVSAVGGSFSGGVGQNQMPDKSSLLGPDEAKRFAASAPKPDVRFHYRVTATDHALAAADLLPRGSQAYAATLCWATRFAFDSSDEKRADEIYKRYVRTGARQAWATRFGRVCPQPDFAAARDYWPKRIVAWPVEMLGKAKRHPAPAAGAALVGLLLLGGAVFAFRRWRASALRSS
jgi:tetratricopeptide (TPR) repeat protein